MFLWNGSPDGTEMSNLRKDATGTSTTTTYVFATALLHARQKETPPTVVIPSVISSRTDNVSCQLATKSPSVQNYSLLKVTDGACQLY